MSQIGNAHEPDPRQLPGDGVVDAQRRNRQLPDTLGQPAIGHDAATVAGQRMGSAAVFPPAATPAHTK